jgi:hypothetical protein
MYPVLDQFSDTTNRSRIDKAIDPDNVVQSARSSPTPSTHTTEARQRTDARMEPAVVNRRSFAIPCATDVNTRDHLFAQSKHV